MNLQSSDDLESRFLSFAIFFDIFDTYGMQMTKDFSWAMNWIFMYDTNFCLTFEKLFWKINNNKFYIELIQLS